MPITLSTERFLQIAVFTTHSPKTIQPTIVRKAANCHMWEAETSEFWYIFPSFSWEEALKTNQWSEFLLTLVCQPIKWLFQLQIKHNSTEQCDQTLPSSGNPHSNWACWCSVHFPDRLWMFCREIKPVALSLQDSFNSILLSHSFNSNILSIYCWNDTPPLLPHQIACLCLPVSPGHIIKLLDQNRTNMFQCSAVN